MMDSREFERKMHTASVIKNRNEKIAKYTYDLDKTPINELDVKEMYEIAKEYWSSIDFNFDSEDDWREEQESLKEFKKLKTMDEVLNYKYAGFILCWYADRVGCHRWKQAEPYILKYPETATRYAVKVLRCKWVEGEEIIATCSHSLSLYERFLDKERFKQEWRERQHEGEIL